MNSPELPTAQEEKAISEMVEVDIDAWVESQKVHEMVVDDDDGGDLRSVVRRTDF